MPIMQHKGSIRDETWSPYIWHYHDDGIVDLQMGKPQLLNLQARRPSNKDEIRKGLEAYISLWKKWIDKGGEQYWHSKIYYWENIYNALDMPFRSVNHSTTHFYPYTLQEIKKKGPTMSSYEVMEAYFRENFPTIDDCIRILTTKIQQYERKKST